jgi:hypothetical protein
MSDTAESQARAQVASIVAMVVALHVNYERLEELRDIQKVQCSISHGTMRPQDVLPALLDTLAEHDKDAYTQYLHIIPAHASEDDGAAWWIEEAPDHVEALFDALNDCAPEGLYFGAHPGDGSDYGFWLSEEDMVELTELEGAAGENTSEEQARERILEDALSVEVRSDWETSASEFTASEFRIVLCTGGPHVEIVGDIDRGTPSRVRVIYKDWGTSGELFDFDHAAVIEYCQQFYFGE